MFTCDCWHSPHSMQSSIYGMVQCLSVYPSVSPRMGPQLKASAAALQLWAWWAGDIDRLLQLQQMNAGRATLSAYLVAELRLVISKSRIYLATTAHKLWQSLRSFMLAALHRMHTHLFNSPLSRTTLVNRYQKGKTNLDFTEARDSEWQWHQVGHMQVCTSLQTDNHASARHSVLYRPDALPAIQPTASKHGMQ